MIMVRVDVRVRVRVSNLLGSDQGQGEFRVIISHSGAKKWFSSELSSTIWSLHICSVWNILLLLVLSSDRRNQQLLISLTSERHWQRWVNETANVLTISSLLHFIF